MNAKHATTQYPSERPSFGSGVREGILVWYAVFGSIAAWIVHLVYLSSVVQFTCNTRGWTWTMHTATAVTLAMTTAALALSARLVRRDAADEENTDASRQHFLGLLGLVIGVANALLIVVEEIYLLGLGSHR